MNYLQVAIKTPLRRTFDYLPKKDVDVTTWQIGQRVKVPFGRREVVGIIVGLSEASEFPAEKLKSVIELVDIQPLLHNTLMSLYHWASDYYQHPMGDVILGTLPKKIREGSVSVSVSVRVRDDEYEDPAFTLTQEQQDAIEKITQTRKFQPFLLAGVTGSGKTEVYMRVIADVLQRHQQALVLVPEISLTPQTVSRFEKRFSVPVLLLHSGLSDVKRYKAWMQATHDQACIVIGTRSAVFAPLKNCGVIIVDEEHDVSFKQQNGFRYSARDVAVMRAKLTNIPVILGTATPSLESWKNVRQNKYHLLTLSERAGNATLPPITLHNICGEKLQQGFSASLIAVMKKHLDDNNQVLLFLNRRGYAPVLMCHHCGWVAVCVNCDARMTAHDHPKRLLCHHCGYQAPLPRICQSCKQSELMTLGMGTEQLEAVISQLFPHKTICRIDRDAIKNFTSLEKTLEKIHQREADIIIGTQMVVKGHHFEHVTLVVALDVDHALFSSDFRAVERLGQSLIQVAGRAGRTEKNGEVFIQTHHPEHPLLQLLFQSGHSTFLNALLDEREKTQLPPFISMTVLRAEAKDKKRVHAFLEKAKRQMTCDHHSLQITGPLASVMERKAGVYRMQLLLQSSHRATIKQALHGFFHSITNEKSSAQLKWMVDVDPVEV